MPRTSTRPGEEPTERTTDLTAASVTDRRLERRATGLRWPGCSGSSSPPKPWIVQRDPPLFPSSADVSGTCAGLAFF